jgi:hypothetical protein
VSESVKCLLIPLEERVLKIVQEKLVMGKNVRESWNKSDLYIRVRSEIVNPDPGRPKGQTKEGNILIILCFKELDVLSGWLEA